MWVVGHFHFTMAAAAFLASFAAIYFWFPKMYGRMMDDRLGKIHFWFSVIFITLVFGGQLLVGYGGQQRRLWDAGRLYPWLNRFADANRWTSYFGFLLGVGQIFFVINLFKSIFSGKKAGQNPWEVGTLEWTHATSPPAYHNFDVIPEVKRGPHEYANPEARKTLGRDWLGQADDAPAGVPSGEEKASGGKH
jgi:cytochrome c oxidase subunit 1